MKTSIYNLFPPILGHISNWYNHIDRIKNMGFEWIYINPITYPGFSGSLYAVKDYYKYNENFFSSAEANIAEKELKDFLKYCKKNNIKVMIDLVINHSSKDSVLVDEHFDWYLLDDEGKLKSPGAWDNGVWIEWGDLASFNNEKTEEGDNPIWEYWRELILHNLSLGFDGFRCDAAYKVNKDLWIYLINTAKTKKKETVFFAESLGCSMEDTLSLIEAGFDYVASSAKWWDYESEWFIEQYDLAREKSKQIAFPSHHDTLRLINEYNGNICEVMQRFLFTAMVCDMWMITFGDEYGFYNRCDVVKGNEIEKISYDLSEFIKDISDYIKNNDILANCGRIVSIDLQEKKLIEELKKKLENQSNENNENNNENIEDKEEKKNPLKRFYKYSLDEKDVVLIVINTSNKKEILEIDKYNITEDISFNNRVKSFESGVVEFLPYQLKIFKVVKTISYNLEG